MGWKVFYGMAVLCGIGFTMSLLISSLAFEPGSLGERVGERICIIAGSFLSAIIGYLILRSSLSYVSARELTKRLTYITRALPPRPLR